MTTTIQQDLWELASVLAMVRLGLVPLRLDNRKLQPPKKDLAQMPTDEARKARRKYRKLWRRALARELRDFEKTPKRRQKREFSWCGEYIKGKWTDCDDDPLGTRLLRILHFEVGERPSPYARGYRWSLVKASPEFDREIVKAARELGLMHRTRSM